MKLCSAFNTTKKRSSHMTTNPIREHRDMQPSKPTTPNEDQPWFADLCSALLCSARVSFLNKMVIRHWHFQKQKTRIERSLLHFFLSLDVLPFSPFFMHWRCMMHVPHYRQTKQKKKFIRVGRTWHATSLRDFLFFFLFLRVPQQQKRYPLKTEMGAPGVACRKDLERRSASGRHGGLCEKAKNTKDDARRWGFWFLCCRGWGCWA